VQLREKIPSRLAFELTNDPTFETFGFAKRVPDPLRRLCGDLYPKLLIISQIVQGNAALSGNLLEGFGGLLVEKANSEHIFDYTALLLALWSFVVPDRDLFVMVPLKLFDPSLEDSDLIFSLRFHAVHCLLCVPTEYFPTWIQQIAIFPRLLGEVFEICSHCETAFCGFCRQNPDVMTPITRVCVHCSSLKKSDETLEPLILISMGTRSPWRAANAKQGQIMR
jgi:hypothetical protein